MTKQVTLVFEANGGVIHSFEAEEDADDYAATVKGTVQQVEVHPAGKKLRRQMLVQVRLGLAVEDQWAYRIRDEIVYQTNASELSEPQVLVQPPMDQDVPKREILVLGTNLVTMNDTIIKLTSEGALDFLLSLGAAT